MTTYSCGFSEEDLSSLGLSADILLKGRDASYTVSNSPHEWEVPRELTTSNEVYNYGDSFSKDFEKNILEEGDTVILTASHPYITVHKMRRDGIKVLPISFENDLDLLE